MISRVVEIGSAAHLHAAHGQLVIKRPDEANASVPFEDLGLLILDSPAITHTQAVLRQCMSHDVGVVITDDKHLPTAMLLPMQGHSLQSRTLAQQAALSLPTSKRIWKSIVHAKILEQARTLENCRAGSGPLPAMACRVRSGDPDNIEAQAARAYWQRLFGVGFRRDQDGEGINAALNYGYAVIRSAVARAVCGAGLHPSFGLMHHNQYNAYCLADDLVEPLRPLVDEHVYRSFHETDIGDELTVDQRHALLEVLLQSVLLGKRKLPLLSALHAYTASLRREIEGQRGSLEIPRR